MGRTPCCSKEGLTKGSWSALEDKLLTDYIKIHGEGKWKNIPKLTGLKRCGKSCRLRWLNYLRPDIKRGNISEDEEDLIIRLHKLLGNRWSLIAGRLPGRTDNEIKNYWNTTLAKKVKAEQSKQSMKKSDDKTPFAPGANKSNVTNTEASKDVTRPWHPAEENMTSKVVATATPTDHDLSNNGNNILSIGSDQDSDLQNFMNGELLLSDVSDSEFFKLYQLDNSIEEAGGSTGKWGSLDQAAMFSDEEMLKDWIRDDGGFLD